ncbi:MAG TPA: 3-carboxymuconate cyclase [Acidobacteria bacterium]|nr:3-carboxymuconate cyclase [Acidobacteriota bacterium]HCE02905.1 3-carboxymuconate cyclase [Acidobacteriota bacterium]
MQRQLTTPFQGGTVLTRRIFLSLVAGSVAASRFAFAQPASQKTALYANVGPDLTHYDVDVAGAALIRQSTVTLPARVQYAWPHVSRRYLYVASSSSAPGYGQTGTEHHISAFRIDPTSGALTPHGEPIRLPTRPIHMSTDMPSENILVAFNNPSALRVYRINRDFTPGEEVRQPGPIDAGIYAHQVRVTPDNRLAILVARGNEGTPARAEDPGALKVFDYRSGVLTNGVTIAPNGGKEFGPRHLDFHPTKPWIYVSIETQNKMYTYMMASGTIAPEIAFRADTLADPQTIRSRQAASTVHVHPNGRFLYGANRAQATNEIEGKQVFVGGENNIVVYSIDQSTGEPTAIQHIETRAIHPRTFHIDPGGRMLVAQHNLPVNVRADGGIRLAPAGLSVFRIGDDGKLTYVRKYDIDVGDTTMFWMGMVPL